MHQYFPTLINGGASLCAIQRLKPYAMNCFQVLLSSYNLRRSAEDYDLDRLHEKLEKNFLQREETSDAVAACAQEGYRVVNAYVAFAEVGPRHPLQHPLYTP